MHIEALRTHCTKGTASASKFAMGKSYLLVGVCRQLRIVQQLNGLISVRLTHCATLVFWLYFSIGSRSRGVASRRWHCHARKNSPMNKDIIYNILSFKPSTTVTTELIIKLGSSPAHDAEGIAPVLYSQHLADT